METLGHIGEDALIKKLIAQAPHASSPHEGPGDDCAVIDVHADNPTLQLLKADAIVEGIHYSPNTPAHSVGWKSAARVISDFAAMGGTADHFLVTIALPASTTVDWATELYRGLGDCLRDFGATLAGGETTAVPEGSAAVISIAATGFVNRAHLVLRSSGNIGDRLLVTGRLGGSIKGKHLTFTPRQKEANWLASKYKPTAMMDLSDGLAKDLPRLAAASGCDFKLDLTSLPLTADCSVEQALNDGEDYEMLMAVEPSMLDELIHDWAKEFPELPLTPIGELVEPGKGQGLSGGWEHFTGDA